MQNLGLVLLVFGFVCAVIACFQAAQPWWNKLVAAAIAFMIAAELFGGLAAMHVIR
jgi:Na+-translocating ferredoxin:NAD+ oxidoreductase RnfD subunit